jgi:hypothetical protein
MASSFFLRLKTIYVHNFPQLFHMSSPLDELWPLAKSLTLRVNTLISLGERTEGLQGPKSELVQCKIWPQPLRSDMDMGQTLLITVVKTFTTNVLKFLMGRMVLGGTDI